MRALVGSIGIAAVLTAAACTTATEWRHPSLSEDRGKLDAAQCRRAAIVKVEEEEAHAERFGAGSGGRLGDGPTATTTREAMMTRFEAERREERLTERCMTALGYVKENVGAK